MNKPFVALALLTVLVVCGYAAAQNGYTVAHYTDDNGMPQNSVRSLAADADGFIWLATENGLTRFDGQRFHIFDKDFIGTTSNRFYLIQPSFNQISGRENKGKIAGKEIYAAADFNQFVRIQNGIPKVDSAYFKSKISGLPYFDGTPRTFFSVGLPTYLRDIVRPHHYIIPDSHGYGDFWVVDSTKIEFFTGKMKTGETHFSSRGKWWNFFSHQRKLYHRNEDGTILTISKTGTKAITVGGDLLRDSGFQANLDNSKVFWNPTNDQLYFYRQRRLYMAEEGPGGELSTRLIVDGFDLEERAIESVYRDAVTQTVFLGSPSKGLYVLTRQSFEALTFPDDAFKNVFYAVLPKSQSSVLTPTGMILGKDVSTGETIYDSIPLLRKLNAGDKRSLCYDSNGLLWVKAGDSLHQLSREGDRLLKSWNFGTEIKHIYADHRSNIWIATGDKGLFIIETSVEYPRPKLLQKTVKGTYLQTYGEQMLVGSTRGLYIFDVVTGKHKLLEGTEGIFIKSLYVDNGKRIWMTAISDGLLLYQNGKLIRFPLDRNRYLGSPHCIVDDGHGFFWVPTDKGLFQISVKDLLAYQRTPFDIFYLYHAKEEGFLTNEFNGGCQPCGLTLPNGTVSLPSLNGLIWFRPEKTIARLPDAGIILDKVLVNSRLLAGLGDTLLLPANPVQARFFFSTPYFGNAYNLNLAYALIGANEKVSAQDWIPIQNNDFSIAFSNFAHGTHTLLLRKANGFGKDNYTIRKICVIVPPLWYQTWWAKGLLVVLIIYSFYLYNAFRIRNISREKARLEQVVAKRTESLNAALHDAEASRNELRRQLHMLSRLLTSMTHDIQSPLNYIMLTSGSIPGMVDKGELDVVSEIGQVISNSSRQMSELLRGLLDYIKVHVYGNSIQFEQVNLRTLVAHKYEIFKVASEQKGNTFRNEVPLEASVSSDAQMLAIMVHNLIDNAVKFTDDGIIRIWVSGQADENMVLHIANTGTGIPPHVIGIINLPEREEAGDIGTPLGRKTGLGLLIVKEVAALINIRLHVASEDGETRFTLRFG
nr:ATP-binding protein [uncultured Dyadobacter sp.]